MIAYFDMFSGISGDMTLGAFVDLGVPLAWLKKQLESMPLSGFAIDDKAVWRNGIKAMDITVTECAPVPPRNYRDIQALVSGAPFSARVIGQSLDAFKKIALAESRIHGTDLESVHFHEVGGIDALVDIVGAFLCAEYLGITRVFASPVPLGRGSVRCSHGVIPVPAPATLAILDGVPVTTSDMGMETVTPTGAAIITTLAHTFGPLPDMVMGKVGYGAGKRKSVDGLPNLLRIIMGKPVALTDTPFINKEMVWVVETTIDDMIPEVLGYIMDKLFEKGALDVCHIPVQMKKNRPGTRLEVICRGERLNDVMDLILTQSSSIGVRFHKVQRGVLHREIVEVPTCFGQIKAKKIIDPAGAVRIVPEYEACRRVAEAKKIPLQEVYTRILATVHALPAETPENCHGTLRETDHPGRNSKSFPVIHPPCTLRDKVHDHNGCTHHHVHSHDHPHPHKHEHNHDHGNHNDNDHGHFHDHVHGHDHDHDHDHDHEHEHNQTLGHEKSCNKRDNPPT